MTGQTNTAQMSSPLPGQKLCAVYRLQMRGEMDFKRATGLVPYFQELGISHLYLSPIFTAVPGSSHGYDVTDPNQLDPALGSEHEFIGLSEALHEKGLGLVVDFVPNHVAAHPANPWFRDVLRWGPRSRYARHFDIDWSSSDLLLGMLGASYGSVLGDGGFALSVGSDLDELEFCYGDLHLPLAPQTYAMVLAQAEHDACTELAHRYAAAHPDQTRELGQAFAALHSDDASRTALEGAIKRINSQRDELHAIHEAQIWRLAHWRAARDMLTYRRFFEISDLIGLTVERGETFADVHEKLLALVAAGHIDAIRLDHIDGLADPAGYLECLADAISQARGSPVPLFVEKILETGERLPGSWAVAGTTGYEFIADVSSALVDPAGAEPLSAAYARFTGLRDEFDAVVQSAKQEIVSWNLASEHCRVTAALADIARKDLLARDFGPTTLALAVKDLAVAMPVYRTYIDSNGPSEGDSRLLEQTFNGARAISDVDDRAVFDFMQRVMQVEPGDADKRRGALDFVIAFQQMTGPVMAKAVEDTAFYRFNRLISLNEVGGAPDLFGCGVAAFHESVGGRPDQSRSGLNATATHDTKRGEDARARIHAISEMPGDWAQAVQRWSDTNTALKRGSGNARAPDANTEWLFYQALAGSWPAESREDIGEADWSEFTERMSAFMLKAVREAKLHTSWLRANEPYEEAVGGFVRDVLDPRRSGTFLDDFEAFCTPLFRAGVWNSLAQTLLKLTVPGIPDIYQGTELWDLSLVDPDNRRSPDWQKLAETQRLCMTLDPAQPTRSWRDATVKFSVLAAALAVRAEKPDLFLHGEYIPLRTGGKDGERVVAFARANAEDVAVVAVRRLPLGREGIEPSERAPVPLSPDTSVRLPKAHAAVRWRNVIAGGSLEPSDNLYCRDLWPRLPVALLVRQD